MELTPLNRSDKCELYTPYLKHSVVHMYYIKQVKQIRREETYRESQVLSTEATPSANSPEFGHHTASFSQCGTESVQTEHNPSPSKGLVRTHQVKI